MRKGIVLDLGSRLLDYMFQDTRRGCLLSGYPQRNLRNEVPTLYCARPKRSSKFLKWSVWVLAVILVILSTIGYHGLVPQLNLVVRTPLKLLVFFSAFPTEIDIWTGQDVPIPKNIQRIAGNDDLLNRFYVAKTTNEWGNVYTAHSTWYRTMLVPARNPLMWVAVVYIIAQNLWNSFPLYNCPNDCCGIFFNAQIVVLLRPHEAQALVCKMPGRRIWDNYSSFGEYVPRPADRLHTPVLY